MIEEVATTPPQTEEPTAVPSIEDTAVVLSTLAKDTGAPSSPQQETELVVAPVEAVKDSAVETTKVVVPSPVQVTTLLQLSCRVACNLSN